uniref:Protein FAR1-RELATED SEQUENCE n=1 Tax=Kalanchoe fedtschenkoi TaxID=63787 RepID=A0A7N0T2Q7_KALFE
MIMAETCPQGELHDDRDDEDAHKPHVGMKFESVDSAKSYYDAYARRAGFSTSVGQYNRAKPDGPIVSWDFACSKEVFKRKNADCCNAALRIERKDPGVWVVTKFVEDHNHSIVRPNKVYHLPTRRHFAGSKNNGETAQAATDRPVSMDGNPMSFESHTNVSSGEQFPTTRSSGSMSFTMPYSQRKTLGKDAHDLLGYFKNMQAENPGFFYAIQVDEGNRITNVFWADARSRTAYNHFGDAVIFDTMYRPNQYQVSFAPFTGINHHGQMVLFGCALILDESEASFTWLFSTWLSAMNGRPPVSFTTDQDRAIQAAVSQVFPKTRHCICKWHILREGRERLAHVFIAHPPFHGELYSCINFSETIEEFESSWNSLLDKYNLQKNEWLQAVFKARNQWVPVYFRDTFFAALSSNHGVGSIFDQYVNQQTSLPLFFRQYEMAVERSLEEEIEADYDTINNTPFLKTPSPMEQQAANLYTKTVFMKFQEELVETFIYTANKIDVDGPVTKFRVVKYEHDHKAYTVSMNISEMKASCSCKMFEYSGILCRHILTVFTVTNVLTVPPNYILKRWTRNARTGAGMDEQNVNPHCAESLTARFNGICREAVKLAEHAAICAESYDVAINALRDAGKKIAVLKRNSTKPLFTKRHRSGNIQVDSNMNTALLGVSETPSLWPWQEPNLNHSDSNYAGLSVADLNQTQPTMAVASMPDPNETVLTYYKSMTWVIENRTSAIASKVAVIKLKLQDYAKTPADETEVQFRVTKVSLEPMLKSMSFISQQLSAPSNKVAVINLKLQDMQTTTGGTELKFQVSRSTLASLLASMDCIQEYL